MDVRRRLWCEVSTFLLLFIICLLWYHMGRKLHMQAEPEEKKEGWDPLCTEN